MGEPFPTGTRRVLPVLVCVLSIEAILRFILPLTSVPYGTDPEGAVAWE